ncbi:hypothetical protein SAMN05443574_12522 [Haloarcula vallismortis]|uniref:Uncharacterized protein n=2 Tax=Haloarcula vallismortis TaxID=28442 RepID=M0JHG4_HALVA|nr:hypothetical protein [Haloarcula vallismortis]EMA07813.1 hypothetical protein C437_08813 [Haloarcula vallismortis ATCC 29715]SDX29384.1 hypothetical protein SAMN05443574_12522 [Haloarcula vallismortis]
MSDDQLFIVVEGVGPADFPETEASSNKQDEAVTLANDIHDLLREEYGKEEIEGVIPVINPDAHQQMQATEL